ncbi:hypothetical protein EON65_25835 [archaeon]|nr:MAG: hypothetical protein EON65_25835 [archaeon]
MEEDLLDERISSLTKELEESGREIVSLALATYDAHELAKVFDASTAKPLKFDLKHPPQQMVPLFVEEVNELLRKSQEQQKFLSEHKHKIDYCQHLSATLQHISGIIDKLVQAEDAILNADLLLAAKLLGEMQSLLQNKPTPKDIDLNNPLMKSTLLSSTTPVYKALSKEYKLHKARLVNKCKRLLQDCITVEIGRVNVCTILTGYIRSEDKVIDKAIQLTHIYDVLVQLEADRSVIDHYLHLFFRHIVKLFYKEKKAYLPNTTITPYTVTVNGTATQGIQSEFMLGSMVKGGYNVAELQEQVDENCSAYYALGTSKLPLSDVFNHLAQFVVFLSAQVFLGHESVSTSVTKPTVTPSSPLILSRNSFIFCTAFIYVFLYPFLPCNYTCFICSQ